MKQKLLILLVVFIPALLFAQTKTVVRGSVIGAVSQSPIPGVIVNVVDHNQQTTTDADGQFILRGLKPGRYVIQLNSVLITPKSVAIDVERIGDTELQPIQVTELTGDEDLSMVGVIDLETAEDDGGSNSQEVNSTVVLSNDVFLNKTSFNLSPFRFNPRAYSNTLSQQYINGVAMNDQNRGVFNYAAIGALNDMTRNGDITNFNAVGTYTFGSLGGTENINMRASQYAAGHKISLSYTNRNYYARGMYTYSSGLKDNGWAYTLSAGGRYSHEGNIEGTFYQNVALGFSVEKVINGGEHSVSLVGFVSPVARGQQSASYMEAYQLTGNYLYNPNWGYYDGEKRNSRVVRAWDPTLILSYIWKVNDKTTLTAGIGTHYQRYGGSALNWYDAADPRPDYYRNFPSYFKTSPSTAELYRNIWTSNNTDYTQINWNKLYQTNLYNNKYGNGAAIYMVEERRSDLFEATFNSTLRTRLNNRNLLTLGVETRHSRSMQFKTVQDLLGARYLLDIDKYAERDFPGALEMKQNDLDRPNRKVYKDGIFGYNFDININSASIWAVNEYQLPKWDIYYGAKAKFTSFNRYGRMRNGRAPLNSYGWGATHSFMDLGVKAGFTYKFNGRHFLSGNISYGTDAPLPNDAYLMSRTSDGVIDGLQSGRVFSADLNYIFSTQNWNGRIGVYQTNMYDQLDKNAYYDDSQRTFIYHTLNGVNKIHRGVELGLTYKLDDHWSFDAAGTLSEAYYTNNPMGSMSSENGIVNNKKETVYMKNLYVSGVPQFAGTFGVRYFIDYWFLGANINGVDRNYIDIAPLRRISSIYSNVVPGSPEYEVYKQITAQEKFKGAYTIDLSVGKIIYLNRKQSLNFNLSVNNLLNRKDIVIGGYEQGRFDTKFEDPNRYGDRYYMMQGLNVFLNASYRF